MTPTIDPVRTEIIRSALLQAAEDMNTTLIRSAYTPTIYEAKDCAVAIMDRHHQVLGQSSGLPIFLGNLEEVTRDTESRFGRDVWQPGDVWVLNDAYIAGAHLNDVTVFGPVFERADGGELIGFAASRAHWIDLGSKDPGGSMDSTSIYQEGLRLGATRIYAAGEPVAEVLRLIATNSRFPSLCLEICGRRPPAFAPAQTECVRLSHGGACPSSKLLVTHSLRRPSGSRLRPSPGSPTESTSQRARSTTTGSTSTLQSQSACE